MSVGCHQYFGRETLASLLKNPNRMDDRSSPQARGDCADRLFGETLHGLTEGLRDTGHEQLLASTGDSMEREEAQLRALIGWAPGATTRPARCACSKRHRRRAHR